MNTTDPRWQSIARIISGIAYPFFIPILSYWVLFNLTFLSALNTSYKVSVLSLVLGFTILIPWITIGIFFYVKKWNLKEMVQQERRLVPYMLTFISYFTCYVLMRNLLLPDYLISIILSTLIIIGVCTLINTKWKISAHMAGMGGMIGGYIAFSLLLRFSNVYGLCFLVLIASLVATARLILKRHSPFQLLAGFLLGFFVSYICIIY